MTKRRASRRQIRQALFCQQQPIFQIHEPALESLIAYLYGQGSGVRGQESGDSKTQPDPETVAKRLGMQMGSGEPIPATTQMVGQVAVLPIFGVLQQKASWVTRYMGWTATEILERDFRAAVDDSTVKAIVLYCDSPGGTAIGNEEVFRTMHAARGKKPIVAYVRGMCASACYYLAVAAERIVASPSSSVGSIGTIWVHAEYSKRFQAMGIGINVLRHGQNKALGNPHEALTPEAKAKLQKWIDDYGNQFEAAVAKGRGVSAADVQSKFGQGDVFLAAEAKSRGLIDQVASWEQLLASLQTAPALAPQQAQAPQPGQQVLVARAGAGGAVAADLGPVGGVAAVTGPDVTASLAPDARLLMSTGETPVPAIFGEWLNASGAESLNASGNVAAASAAIPEPVFSIPESKNVKITARMKAALFAKGLVASADADDAMCLVAIGAFFAARGEACPQDDENKVCNALFSPTLTAVSGQLAVVSGPGTTATGNGQVATGAAANVTAAHERETAEAREAAAAVNERQRAKLIKASGALLNMSAEDIDAAIDAGKPHAEVVAGWHTTLATKEKPISAGGAGVKVGQDGAERYVQDAAVATLLHYGVSVPSSVQVTPAIEQLASAPIWVHAEHCLKAAGVRYDAYDREDIAAKALAMGGLERENLRAEGGAFNRPGNFPNLLSNLASKVLDEGVEAAETSYQHYTGRWPGDLPDFKPAPVTARSGYGSLDEVLDAEAFKEQGLSEECLSFMVLGRFGNHVKLTPVLVANDDLGAFMDELGGLSEAWELTKNRSCLSLVTGNVTLLDTYALYDDTNHGNITASGAAPSVTSWDLMQQKMAAQTTVGGKAKSRARLAVALVPPKHEVAAAQTFLPLNGTVIVEGKTATADSGLNPFRSKVKVVPEPELASSSADIWYGFSDPSKFRNATIVIAYFRGWGQKGKRERWYDPQTKCWCVSLEGRFGTAAKNYRTTVRNPGA